jgi:hypothetical protein
MATSENMRIWNVLGKTDPAHTKQFTRAGGFKGTAVKPMWTNLKMTELFGPCGIGWGQTEPIFQTIPTDGEILVYCTVGLWYMDGRAKCGPVFGVGGDKVLTQIFEKDRQGNKIKDEETGRFRTYPQTDDEAFKKAYTDAISNAMKFIGVAADVHMGMFDDNKYVQAVRQEFADEQKAAVVAEVERQKAAFTPTPGAAAMTLAETLMPPELDWSYQKTTGILICRLLSVNSRKKKDGKGEYLTVQVNGQVGGKKADVLTYFHSSGRDALLASVGKIAKLETEVKGDFANIVTVLEVDGQKIEPESETDETKARLIASVLGWEEEQLRETWSGYCRSSWPMTLQVLRDEQARREAEVLA